MVKLKMKVNNKRFTVPVPYAFLHLGIRVLTSKKLLAMANHAIAKEGKTKFQIPHLNKDDFKPLLKELSKQKGLLLVETRLNDGTEVSIRL